jgi:2-succinyl-6-hydroxy-2,4-cyclohexadiene-1-carboxylate synthase
MTLLRVNDVHLNVETHPGPASAPVLVMMHGFTGSVATWRPHLGALVEHCTVVAIDALGHGASDAPTDAARYAMSHVVADYLAVMDHLGVERFGLLGYSMGGRMALHIAAAASARVQLLILESASPGLATAAERKARIAADEQLALMLEREGIAAFVDRWEAAPLWDSQHVLPAGVRRELRQQRLASNPVGLANSLRGAGTGSAHALYDQLMAIGMRTLLIAGALDTKFAAIARKTHSALPDATLQIVPDAGHAVHLEAPDLFNSLVIEFIRRHAWHL